MTYFPNAPQEKPHQQVFHAPLMEDHDDDDWAEQPPLTYEEEQQQRKREHWQMIARLGDLGAVVAGVIVILFLLWILISLVNWVVSDMVSSFTLLQAWF